MKKNGNSYINPLKKKFGPEFFRGVPKNPGVYFMYDRAGSILYIGKAKSLRIRLSSYRRARPDSVPENVIELLEKVESVRWENCLSEEEAFLRERELLHAIRPPFNIADAWEEDYLFIGTCLEKGAVAGSTALRFRLTSREEEAGYRLYGCFRHRPRIKSGYTALIRLMYAVTQRRERFAYPARITRTSPPYDYALTIPTGWKTPLHGFLAGRDARFIQTLVREALKSEFIPVFMYPSLQLDIERVKEFFRLGPQATRRLIAGSGLKTRLLKQRKMDQLIQDSLGDRLRPSL